MTQKTFQIGNHQIGPHQTPYVIAEMSGNHNQSLDRALEIVEAAANAGAHALKIQTYTADTMTIDSDRDEFNIREKASLWQGQSLYKLYQQAYTPWEWHKPIFDRCKELGITAFSTPFDASAVDFLESLNVPAYKIASFENTDIPLIKKVARTKKPVIISTGMANVSEISEAVDTLRAEGCEDFVLLKCTSAYPSLPSDCNIATIPHMAQMFDCNVGLSDHTLGIGVAVASVVMGACVIEKHFTLRRADGGVDSAFSLEPHELKLLVEEISRAYQSIGKVSYGISEKEKDSLRFRRSLFVVEDMQEGELFTDKNVRTIRPGYGLAPKYIETVIGKRATCKIARGTPLSWNLFR